MLCACHSIGRSKVGTFVANWTSRPILPCLFVYRLIVTKQSFASIPTFNIKPHKFKSTMILCVNLWHLQQERRSNIRKVIGKEDVELKQKKNKQNRSANVIRWANANKNVDIISNTFVSSEKSKKKKTFCFIFCRFLDFISILKMDTKPMEVALVLSLRLLPRPLIFFPSVWGIWRKRKNNNYNNTLHAHIYFNWSNNGMTARYWFSHENFPIIAPQMGLPGKRWFEIWHGPHRHNEW